MGSAVRGSPTPGRPLEAVSGGKFVEVEVEGGFTEEVRLNEVWRLRPPQ